jgi:2-polyprenyl-3-methyl-5-hydroxy-6-metoxy-1,4-benzoquinol methylase
VVGNRYLSHGILVRRDTRETVGPPAYNETYFEGNTYGLGYGNYSAQEEWRMQKSRRYLRQIEGIALFLGRTLETNTRLLDVGSGYGFFRQAAAEAGWTHDGQDVSEHAARVGHERFGFETFVGTLDDLLLRAPQAYDVVTLFDTIEHLNDPAQSLRVVSQLLAPGGLCALRTPNLCALELDVFGPFYHSLKLEHLHYFSVTSLSHLLLRAGLSPAFVTTESHLLRGLLGTALEVFGREQRGSDLFAVGWKQ